MKLDGGGMLKPATTQSETAFMPFDPSDEKTLEHPPQTLRLRYSAVPPESSSGKVSLFEGSFSYWTAGGSRDLSIENAPKSVRRPLTGEDFKSAEVKFRGSHSQFTPAWLTLSCGKDFMIGRASGMPGDLPATAMFDNEKLTHKFVATSGDGKFPDDFQINFKLYSEVKEQQVKFRFENLPLPMAETKPKSLPMPMPTKPPVPTATPQPSTTEPRPANAIPGIPIRRGNIPSEDAS